MNAIATIPDGAPALTREEFLRRFKARMIERAPVERFGDGVAVADYAEVAATIHWRCHPRKRWEPEACADRDISEWGKEVPW